VVKVILHKTASPPQTDGSTVFTRWRQCAFPCGHNGATWWIRLNLCFLRLTQIHNPNSKSIGSAVLAQLTAESPYTYNGLCFPPKLPLPMGVSRSLSNTWFPAPTRLLNPSRSFQPFLHRQPQSVPILYNGTPLPPQNCPFPWHLDPPESSMQTAPRSVQPFLQGSLV